MALLLFVTKKIETDVIQLDKFHYREMEWRLDKEGREYHHYEDFCKLYRAEILNLNRMLDTLMRNGMLPSNFQLPTGNLSNVSMKSVNVG